MKKFLNLFLVVAVIFSMINFAQAKENLPENIGWKKF